MSAQLASRQWVIGIDLLPAPISPKGSFTESDYRAANQFLYLSLKYSQALAQVSQGGFLAELSGRVETVFLIMPYPSRSFREEVSLWLALASQRSQAYIRSEQKMVVQRFCNAITRPYDLVASQPEVSRLSSICTRILCGGNSGHERTVVLAN